ncbi:hypothetical protein D3C84_1241270 [compost metagenome]
MDEDDSNYVSCVEKIRNLSFLVAQLSQDIEIVHRELRMLEISEDTEPDEKDLP